MTSRYEFTGPRIDLSRLADLHLGGTAGVNPASLGSHTERLLESLDSGQRATSYANTVFWRSFIGTPRYKDFLRSMGASPLAESEGEAFVIAHGEGWGDYDLVVFDPGLKGAEVLTGEVRIPARDLRAGWERLIQEEDLAMAGQAVVQPLEKPPQMPWELTAFSLGEIAVEVGRARQPKLMVLPTPEIELTSGVPTPALAITTLSGPIATVGITAVDRLNRGGVTTALHAIDNKGDQLLIGGIPVSITSEDKITDSCFISVDEHTQDSVHPSVVKGPLTGVTPRGLEEVSFHGIATGSMKTDVIGWSPELPIVVPGSQLKVLTRPVTSPGDSGAALVDSEERVLGFAFYRTGFHSKIEFAAWIWAESVYLAHGLS